VHLSRNVEFWTVITVLTNYPIQYGPNYGRQKLRCQTVQDGATVQYDFDHIWAQNIFFFLQQMIMKNTNYHPGIKYCVDFEFPCKPLLGPSPELTQPQSSLRVVQGSIVWHQHVRGACSRLKWEVLGWRGLSEAIFALAVPAWHRTVNYRNYGKLRSSQIVTTP